VFPRAHAEVGDFVSDLSSEPKKNKTHLDHAQQFGASSAWPGLGSNNFQFPSPNHSNSLYNPLTFGQNSYLGTIQELYPRLLAASSGFVSPIDAMNHTGFSPIATSTQTGFSHAADTDLSRHHSDHPPNIPHSLRADDHLERVKTLISRFEVDPFASREPLRLLASSISVCRDDGRLDELRRELRSLQKLDIFTLYKHHVASAPWMRHKSTDILERVYRILVVFISLSFAAACSLTFRIYPGSRSYDSHASNRP